MMIRHPLPVRPERLLHLGERPDLAELPEETRDEVLANSWPSLFHLGQFMQDAQHEGVILPVPYDLPVWSRNPRGEWSGMAHSWRCQHNNRYGERFDQQMERLTLGEWLELHYQDSPPDPYTMETLPGWWRRRMSASCGRCGGMCFATLAGADAERYVRAQGR